jgi:D-alanyl-D-alanine carboxypeptidase/D-alanyl-D-alanine-endopeptidase (penicillin-binding protein 4)
VINTTTIVSAVIQVIVFFGTANHYADVPPESVAEQTAITAPASSSVARLSAEIDEVLANPLLEQSNVGIKIVSLKNGQTLYSHDADKLYVPASVMKVITTATALATLKPEYRFRTVLLTDPPAKSAKSDASQANTRHNIYLKGFGDPTLRTHHLAEMVEELATQQVTAISGDIIVNESFFDDSRKGKGWMWDDGPFGGAYAHLSGLSLNHNGVVVQLEPAKELGKPVNVTLIPDVGDFIQIDNESKTVGRRGRNTLRLAIAPRTDGQAGNVLQIKGNLRQNQKKIGQQADVSEPALYAGAVLAKLLAEQSIEFNGAIQYGDIPDNAQEVAIHYSQPLGKIIARTNKESDNMYAETILKTMGAEKVTTPGTAKNGVKVIEQFFKQHGIRVKHEIVDGSGVSRYNLITASILTDVLAAMFQNTEVMSDFLASLPTAGREGTMKYRMRGLASEGVVRAKTGTMTGVNSLAGYNKTADNELVAFAIIVNNYVGSHRLIRLLQDKIVNAIASFTHQDSANVATQVKDTPEAVVETIAN